MRMPTDRNELAAPTGKPHLTIDGQWAMPDNQVMIGEVVREVDGYHYRAAMQWVSDWKLSQSTGCRYCGRTTLPCDCDESGPCHCSAKVGCQCLHDWRGYEPNANVTGAPSSGLDVGRWPDDSARLDYGIGERYLAFAVQSSRFHAFPIHIVDTASWSREAESEVGYNAAQWPEPSEIPDGYMADVESADARLATKSTDWNVRGSVAHATVSYADKVFRMHLSAYYTPVSTYRLTWRSSWQKTDDGRFRFTWRKGRSDIAPRMEQRHYRMAVYYTSNGKRSGHPIAVLTTEDGTSGLEYDWCNLIFERKAPVEPKLNERKARMQMYRAMREMGMLRTSRANYRTDKATGKRVRVHHRPIAPDKADAYANNLDKQLGLDSGMRRKASRKERILERLAAKESAYIGPSDWAD